MAKICILGPQGAGKTVFISVLANRYREILEGKPYMEFKNGETNGYVAEVWGRLCDHERSDWPGSTENGKRLEWVVHDCDGIEHSMCVLDAVGQDFAAIFSDVGICADENLGESARELKRNILEADCIVFLVNLVDIENAKPLDRATEYETPIVNALKDLLTRDVRIAVLLSQHDRLKKSHPTDWLVSAPIEVLKKYIPSIYKTLKEREDAKDERVYLDFVSAVADTEWCSEEKRDVPKANFRSYGLDEAFAWMVQSLSFAGKKKLSAWRRTEMRSAFGNLARAFAVVTGFVAICAGVAFLAVEGIERNKKGAVYAVYEEDECGLEKKTKEKDELLSEKVVFRKNRWAREREIDNRRDKRIQEVRDNLLSAQSDFDKEKERIEAAKEKIEDKKEKIEEEKENADELLVPVYETFEWGGQSDSENGEQDWGWGINSAGWGERDGIWLRNKSPFVWVTATLSVTPKDDDEKPFVRKFENVRSGETRAERAVCNFHKDGGTADLTVCIRNFSKERENEKKRTRILETYTQRLGECDQKLEALGQDALRNAEMLAQAKNDFNKACGRVDELRTSELANLDVTDEQQLRQYDVELKKYDSDIAEIRARLANVEAEKQARLDEVVKEMDRIKSKVWCWIIGVWGGMSACGLLFFFRRMLRTYSKKEIPNAGRSMERCSELSSVEDSI